MPIQLDRVVPFGRSLSEYRAMFNLSHDDCCKKILGVGDGPSSFNTEMTKLGHQVVSLDPLHEFTGQEIERRFYDVVDDIIEQVQATRSDWIWTYHGSPEDLRKNRLTALRLFLADYDLGKASKRYRLGQLPHLSHIENESFDIGLCSHFLFLYSELFGLDFHKVAILEMLRVAKEVRLFPLLTLKGERSTYIEPVVQTLQLQGYCVEIRKVQYELQRGGNEMLLVSRG